MELQNGNSANVNGSWRTVSCVLMTVVCTVVIGSITVKCGIDDVQNRAIAANANGLTQLIERTDAIRVSTREIKSDMKDIKKDVKEVLQRTP